MHEQSFLNFLCPHVNPTAICKRALGYFKCQGLLEVLVPNVQVPGATSYGYFLRCLKPIGTNHLPERSSLG